MNRPIASMSRAMIAATVLACAACKLDSVVFSGDAVRSYTLPAGVVPDSLRTEVTFASGGETIYGYWLRQPGAAPRLAVVFSHGKGGNLSQDDEWSHAEYLWQSGFDVLTYDYRGFGRSTGTSRDETTLAADAQAALQFTLSRVPGGIGKVISYGHSLGSAPAITLVANNTGLRALVVESGFANGQAMAESANPLGFPVGWLMRKPMVNTERIAKVTAPVLIMHGENDIQIPVAQGRDLYAAARDPKQLRIVPGAGHGNVEKTLGVQEYRSLVRSFTNAAVP